MNRPSRCRDRHGMTLPNLDDGNQYMNHFLAWDIVEDMRRARGAIGVNQRAQYIGRVRNLARACAASWMGDDADGGAG